LHLIRKVLEKVDARTFFDVVDGDHKLA
jgi:hypothetical protein